MAEEVTLTKMGGHQPNSFPSTIYFILFTDPFELRVIILDIEATCLPDLGFLGWQKILAESLPHPCKVLLLAFSCSQLINVLLLMWKKYHYAPKDKIWKCEDITLKDEWKGC